MIVSFWGQLEEKTERGRFAWSAIGMIYLKDSCKQGHYLKPGKIHRSCTTGSCSASLMLIRWECASTPCGEFQSPHIVLPDAWEAQCGDSPWLMFSLNWSQHYKINRFPPSRASLGHNPGATTIYGSAGFSETTGLLVGGQFAPLFWTWKIMNHEFLAKFGGLFLVLAELVYQSLPLRNAVKETLMSLMHSSTSYFVASS